MAHQYTTADKKNETYQVSFRVITFRTEYKFPDESIKQVLQFIRSVCSIHNIAIVLIVKLGLSTELTAKVFRRICIMHHDNIKPCMTAAVMIFTDLRTPFNSTT